MKSPYRYPPNWIGGLSIGNVAIGGPNDFPVAAGVQKTILAYLYPEWTTGSGSDDLQAFVNAYNEITQTYVDWFCDASLPIYTLQSGSLLDWIALGLYGFLRPLLPVGNAIISGDWPNEFTPNDSGSWPNAFKIVEPQANLVIDDVFQRIMTWHLYLGDGKQFSVPWLKRRVMRFLTGDNGTGGTPITSDVIMALDSFGNPVYWPTFYNVSTTSQISVQFAGNEATIRILSGQRTFEGDCWPNGFAPNAVNSIPDSAQSAYVSFAQFALAPIFQAAVAAGILELPVPYSWTVQLQ